MRPHILPDSADAHPKGQMDPKNPAGVKSPGGDLRQDGLSRGADSSRHRSPAHQSVGAVGSGRKPMEESEIPGNRRPRGSDTDGQGGGEHDAEGSRTRRPTERERTVAPPGHPGKGGKGDRDPKGKGAKGSGKVKTPAQEVAEKKDK